MKMQTNLCERGLFTHSHPPHSIRTYTGRYIDIANPQVDSVAILDIAHALSYMPRFAGHLAHPYSVAQHSVHCAQLAAAEGYDRYTQLAALLHDASEAYICDIPSPIKSLMPEYKIIERRLMEAVAEKFGLHVSIFSSKEVKLLDIYMLKREWHELRMGEPVEEPMPRWSQAEAKEAFIDMFYKLYR
jgi:hypothetical protein